jgi:DNA-binding response OmpR family regulator
VGETANFQKRVLVVDDYDDARDLYSEYLRGIGYRVSTAADGEQALHLALTEQFDAIVLDIALPRLDGLSVLRALRAESRGAQMIILVLSASVGVDPKSAALGAGADLFIEKPCLPDDLGTALEGLLTRGLGRASG